MEELEAIEYRFIRFNPFFPAFKKASEDYQQYEFKNFPPYKKIRKKEDPNAAYTIQIESGAAGLVGRCNCKAFVMKRDSVCKHVFIAAFKMINKLVRITAVRIWPPGVRKSVQGDFEGLLLIPTMDTEKLRVIYEALTKEEPEETSAVEVVSEPDAWESAGAHIADEILKEEINEEKTKIAEAITPPEPKPSPIGPISIDPSKSLVPAPKAFGGTVKDIPKNLVVTLGGKPYVTKAGLIFAASKMGLQSIETEPIHWSWSNNEKRAVFRAKVTFIDGKTYYAYGVAIPDGKNIKMEQMNAFVDHLAETRAIGRALRNALAFRDPSIEEMADYKGGKQ